MINGRIYSKFDKILPTGVEVEPLLLVFHILLRTDSGLCPKTDYSLRNILWSFLRSSKQISAYYLTVGHDSFTAHPLRYIFTKQPHHQTI